MLSTQPTNHVHLVLVVERQKALNQLNVITALEEEKLELIKDFSQFNKHVLSAAGMVKRLVKHVIPAMVMAKSKRMKMLLLKSQKVSMTEQE